MTIKDIIAKIKGDLPKIEADFVNGLHFVEQFLMPFAKSVIATVPGVPPEARHCVCER